MPEPPACACSAFCSVRFRLPRVGVRGGLVRLRDVAVVALAEDADRSVRVRRLLLDGRGDAPRHPAPTSADCPITWRPLPHLQESPGLALLGLLLGQVHVAGFAFDDASFDCDTGPLSPVLRRAPACSRSIGSFLDGEPECERVLIVLGLLPDRLQARATGLLLVGLLLGQVQVAGFGLRGRLVRLPDVTVVALAEDADRALLFEGFSWMVAAMAAASCSDSAD